MNFYAHSLEGKPLEEWQPLDEHLRNVAKLAAEFAKPFGGEKWGYLAGIWHDIGKYSLEFQKRLFDANGVECHLETRPGKVVHSLAGGHLALEKASVHEMGILFCWLIMGHHAGLADYSPADSGGKALEPKLKHPKVSDPILENVPKEIKNYELPPPLQIWKDGADMAFSLRMLFSCLVDADFLETEAFMDHKRAELRKYEYPTIQNLLKSFDVFMNSVCRDALPTEVNRVRAEVLAQCRAAAEREPGVFSLTVPTGGGKTLSSLAFALRHAVKWGKRRIIYVIPYTSIIEQTASVFRSIPGFETSVLEHHSNVLDDDETKETVRSRLASENWDAPIIVTTSVQFFESIYASRTARCRKLHNIANSVVIFDEAQCLPPEYLRPVVFAIRELHRHYGVTPVLCTATQPVLTKTESFDFKFHEGFESVYEIITNPSKMFRRLRRVQIECLNDLKPVSIDDISKVLQAEETAVLCIVNRKTDARELAKRLPKERTIHLSTNLCAEHRYEFLREIHQRLDDGDPLIVVSTSLVEAGVDLDFPVVYRALAGLDSIAQAAGRCNREGKLPKGKTIIYVPENQPQYIQSAATQTRPFLLSDRLDNIFDPATFTEYFRTRFFLLGAEKLDRYHIIEKLTGRLENFSFRTAAERFHIIDDTWQRHLIAPYGEAPKWVGRLIDYGARRILRRLQRYTVSVSERLIQKLVNEGHAHELSGFPGLYHLDNLGLYSKRFGFVPPDEMEAYETEFTII